MINKEETRHVQKLQLLTSLQGEEAAAVGLEIYWQVCFHFMYLTVRFTLGFCCFPSSSNQILFLSELIT